MNDFKKLSAEQNKLSNQLSNIRDKYEALEKQMPKKIIGRNAQKEAENITKQMNKLDAEAEQVYKRLEKVETAMESIKAQHGLEDMGTTEASIRLKEMDAEATKAFKNMSKEAKKSGSVIDAFAKRIKRLALRVFVFSLITRAFRAMLNGIKEGFQNFAQYSKEFNSVMSDFKSQTETLKNSMATAFAPIVQTIIPYLSKLVGWLVTASNAMSEFIARITGKNSFTRAKQQMIDYAKSIKSANAEAQKLANFDDLNVLDNGGSESGGGAVTGADAFEEVAIETPNLEWVDWLKNNLDTILGIVKDIGLAFLAWKIADSILLAFGVGGTIASGIGLIVGAVVLAIQTFKEMAQTGELTDKAFWSLEGAILALGVGFALLIGPIALIPSAIAMVVVAIYKYWDNIKAWWGSVVKFFKDKWKAFTTDVRKGFNNMKNFITGIGTSIKDGFVNTFEKMWNGVKGFINKILGGVEGMVNGIINGINWMIDRLNSFGFDLPDILGGGHVGFTIQKLNTVSIPRLATGGITNRPTFAQIGENGREAVLPLENNTEWMDMLADRIGSGNVTIKFDGSLAQLARVLNPVLDAENARIGTRLIVE